MTGTRPLMSAAMTVRIAPAEFGIITPMKPGSYASNLRARIRARRSAAL